MATSNRYFNQVAISSGMHMDKARVYDGYNKVSDRDGQDLVSG